MANFGGWNLSEVKPCKLPQKAQSAFTAAVGGLTGATYEPVLFAGTQVVNGTNYCIIAIQTFVVPNSPRRLVKMYIHEGLDGKVSISRIGNLCIQE